MKRFFAFFVVTLVLTGCGSTMSTQARPDAYYDSSIANSTGASLFSGDAETLSDEAIRSILAYKYEAPALSRIALVPFTTAGAMGDVSSEIVQFLAAVRP